MKQLIFNILRNLKGGANGLKQTYVERFIPWFPSNRIRNILIRFSGVKATKNVRFFHSFTIRNPKGLVIKDGVNIGPKCLLDARRGLHS